METNGYQDTRYYHCQLDELSDTEFAFTKVTAMDVAYDYWSGHGRNKCSPECLNLAEVRLSALVAGASVAAMFH